jgi:hypothetical protein
LNVNVNVNARTRTHKTGESLISAISVGAVFILIGIVFVLAQPRSLWDSIVNFFSNFTLRSVPNVGISLPAPTNPAVHTVLYTAAFQFSIGIGILQIILLVLRLGLRSSVSKTAEVVGNLVFWFGAAYMITIYLGNSPNTAEWFMFWAGILIMLGLSLIARALVLLTKRI